MTLTEAIRALPETPDTSAFERVRSLLGVGPDVCPGCYLGDDGPATHDLGYGCEYGKGAL